MSDTWIPIGSRTQYLVTLGLSEGCSYEECKAAHRKLLLEWHPDRFPENDPRRAEAERKVIEINQAFDKLQELGFSGPRLDAHTRKNINHSTRRGNKLSRLPVTVRKIQSK